MIFARKFAANTRRSGSAVMLRELAKTVREVWRASGGASGAYRPDLHYMRGPGPKWHAKHAGFLVPAAPSAAPNRPVLRELAEHRA
jgi:hypothetical protein